MAETITYTTPITPPAHTTGQIIRIDMQRETQYILLQQRTNTGEVVSVEVIGPEALTLIQQLNKANLTTKSLEKRALEFMATKKLELTGTINGTPD